MEKEIRLLSEDQVVIGIQPESYNDIFEFNRDINVDEKFLALNRDNRFTTVYVPNINYLDILIEKISFAIFGKIAINSRRLGFLIFGLGLENFEMDLIDIIKMKGLIKQINECGSINGDFKFSLDKLIGKGNGDGGFPMFLSPEHLEKSKEIAEILGCKNGTVAIICIIYAACNTFRNLDKAKINKILGVNPKVFDMAEDSEERKEAERLLTLDRYYKDSGLLREIKEYIKSYEDKLLKYIRMSYWYLKGLERYNEKEKIQMPCISKIIQRIEEEGWAKP